MLLLLLEHDLLLGDLVEQRPEALAGVGCRHGAALGLELSLASLALGAVAGLLLGSGLGGTRALLGGGSSEREPALLLAARLGGKTGLLLGLGLGGLLGGGGLLLGLTAASISAARASSTGASFLRTMDT